ncbi:hypothetical protein AB0M95_14965 [Sphaerisporangium sp. NPDC051017]|uniref:hypothetical protein n=1 Tax=Sphaerisporangium sp. NPDC051017 TaxID=3154636 RepID=UPI003419E8A9
MVTGTILPLGDLAAQHEVLTYYRDEITRMLQAVDAMRQRGLPLSAGLASER